MNIISKVGQRDNVVTYEHICDTRADMEKIEPRYITLGSTCIVLSGESGMEVYMADSTHEWHDLLVSSGSSSGTPSGLSIHICGEEEVQGGKPNVLAPLETELYLVPAREESGNLYDEYVYVNGEWELFGGAPVSLEGVATEAWVSQQGYLTSHQSIPVEDVQINGTSIVNNGVANVPIASFNNYGVVKPSAGSSGIVLSASNVLTIYNASPSDVKSGTDGYKPLTSNRANAAAFYGLAKAAGDATQSASENAVGTYTDSAKSAIQQMLGINTAIATAIGNIHSFDVQVVQTLPTSNIEDHTIYFVPKQGTTNDVYEEYLYINNAWELIGSTQVDLTGYATQSYVNNALAAAETLPAPGANGTGLVSVNGEWVKTPGYGYAATEEFVLGNFTSADFTQEDAEYIATIPLTQEILNELYGMFLNQEEFNVMIDNVTYNSITDQFIYTEDPSIYLQDVFKIKMNSDSTALIFSVPAVPNSAKIYRTTTTYTQFDHRLLSLDLNVKNGAGTMAMLINDIEGNTASGNYATAEGYHTEATADYSHAEGYQSHAHGQYSHTEGRETIAKGTYSHSEGSGTEAVSEGSHAEGYSTLAGGLYSHAEGHGHNVHPSIQIIAEIDTANKIYSVNSLFDIRVDNFIFATNINEIQKFIQVTEIDSENSQIKLSERVLVGQYDIYTYGAFGEASHIEGMRSIAIGNYTHAEGNFTIAKSHASHAEGSITQAIGRQSHAEGYATIASGKDQHVQGRYNIEDTNDTYAHIVGNGGTSDTRSNAHTLDWSGNAWYAGKVTAGTIASPANPTAANDLTTKQYVDNALAAKVVSVEGTTPAITAVADTQYICGEVSTLSFTPSATGTCDVIFESGAVATVLTVPSTVKFPEWFDASALEANTTYEINITNGVYGAVMSWVTA